jgi:bidirectional [NiFe] hydrogenase diaphorase subunit
MSVQNLIQITINDRHIAVIEGTSVLQAARELGIYIPTLCFLEELSPSGACRLCIVEISNPSRNSKISWIDSACVYPVSEGLSIQTDSPRVIRERKLILELLLSRAPDSKQVRELALEYNLEKPRFSAVDNGESNCILCGLCIRVCNELIKANAIGTSQRGIRKEISSPYKIAATLCIGCLACVYVCPTGVIEFELEKSSLIKEEWGVNLDMILCSDCGKPVGTKKQIEQLKEKIHVTDDILSYCPACRRKKNYSFMGV